MHELIFIGLGLNDENGISLQGLEETKTAESVFIELYTSILPDFSKKHFEAMTNKNIEELKKSRH